MQEGMTFTIEAMINMGVKETVLKDGWTVKTKDLNILVNLSILLQLHKIEILTRCHENTYHQ